MKFEVVVDMVGNSAETCGVANRTVDSIEEADAFARELIEDAYRTEKHDEPLNFQKLSTGKNDYYSTDKADYVVSLGCPMWGKGIAHQSGEIAHQSVDGMLAYLCYCLRRDGLKETEKTLKACGVDDERYYAELYALLREFAEYYGVADK